MASTFQFSMRQLLIVVAFVALGMAALMNSNVWWQSAVWMLTILLLSAAILLAVYRADRARAFWIGFLVFGWIQLGAMVYPFTSGGINPLAASSYAVTRFGEWAYVAILPESRRNPTIPDPSSPGPDLSGAAFGGMGMPGGMAPGAGGTMQPMSGMPMAPGPGGMFSGGGGGFAMGMGGMGPGPVMIANPSYVDPMMFINIGHALWLIILAACGGKLAQWIYRPTAAPPRD